MPALVPFCARAGIPASATAAAVTSATAREAGLTGRTLLGGVAGFIWDCIGPSGSRQTMNGPGHGQHDAGAFAAAPPPAKKAREYGSSGAVPPGPNSGT